MRKRMEINLKNSGQLLVVFGLGALMGCSDATVNDDNNGATDSNNGKGDVITSDSTLLPTRNNTLILNKGYHPLFDDAANTCVEQIDKGVRVSDTQDRFELLYVTSREDLANEVGIGGSGSIKRPKIIDATATVDFVNKFKGAENSVNLLLTLEHSYSVNNKGEVDLQARSATKLEQGASSFMSACGSNYVAGLRYGGSFQLLITFSSEETEAFSEFKADLEASSSVVPVNATLNSLIKFEDSGAKSSLSVQALRTGLDSSSIGLADIIESGISGETLSNLEALERSLGNSVRRDQCNDAGQCAEDNAGIIGCKPCDTSPGYFENANRNASVIGVNIGQYNQLFSVDPSARPIFSEITEHWQKVENNVKDLSALHDSAVDYSINDLGAFLAEDGPGKMYYNIKGDPLVSLDALNMHAKQWEDQFNVATGTLTQKVARHLNGCWAEASLDLTKTCESSEIGSTTEIISEIQAALTEYEVSPLQRMRVRLDVIEVNSSEKARKLCEEHPGSWRLPNDGELVHMELLMRNAIEWGDTVENEIYVNDTAVCENAGDDTVYQLNGDSEATLECVDRPGAFSNPPKRRIVCVEKTGLFGE